MAATKTFTALITGATSNTNSSAVNTAGDDYDCVYGSIVQNGTASNGATIQVMESPDLGNTYYSPATKFYTAGVNAGTYQFEIPVDPACSSVKVQYVAAVNGTNSVCTAQLGQVSSF